MSAPAWAWTGEAGQRGTSSAVVMSTGDRSTKRMRTSRPHSTNRDLTGHLIEPVTTDGPARPSSAPPREA